MHKVNYFINKIYEINKADKQKIKKKFGYMILVENKKVISDN
jgi:hypothetical protein